MLPAPSAAAAAGATWLFGTLWALGVVAPWMTPALHALFGLSMVETAGLLLLVCQCGLPFALLGWLLQAGRPATALGRVLYAPAAWVAIEYLRAHVPFGTPWALLGLALADTRTVAQIADLGGAYAITFVLVLASAAGAELMRVRAGDRRGLVPALAVTLVVLLATAGYGHVRRAGVATATAAAPTARVALVHAEVPNGERQDPAQAFAVFERYLALDATVPAGVDLVVWPENAVPLLLEDNPELVARIRAQSRGVPRLIGAPRMLASDGPPSLRASAFLVAGDGIAGVYDKHRLLVLAETMPAFGGGGLLTGRGFVAGAGPTTLAAGPLRVAPLVCYEFIFPELPRAAVRDGARLIANLSNDSWFRPGAGPRQHLLFGRLRTVELRRTMVRAANLGPTTVILPDGTTALETDGVTPGIEVADVPLLDEQTLYARVGDAFAWSCIAGVGVAVAVARRRRGEQVRHGRAGRTAI